MNVRERMIRALAHKEGELPDRVPIFVEGLMSHFKRKSIQVFGKDMRIWDRIQLRNLGNDWKWGLFYKFDSYWLHSTPVRMNPLLKKIHRIKMEGRTHFISRWGHVGRLGVDKTGFTIWYVTGHLNSKEIWQEWIDAGYFDFSISNSWIRTWEKKYPKILDMGLMLVPVDVVFEKIREAFTFAKFAYFLRKERSFMENLTRRIFKIGMEYVKGCCDAGFDVICIADDTAYKNRVMYNPKIFEELVAPRYKELVDYINKRGKLAFYHSDGFLEPYFRGLIDIAGFNGIQSLEPAAGMDLKHIKDEYGDRVTLIGNLDCSCLLPFGSQNEVISATRKCLDDAMAGGGYICGPTTDITDSCNPINIKAMVETVHKFGRYEN